MAGKLKGKKNNTSKSATHMNPANLRKGYTNTKAKQPAAKKKTGQHKPFNRNGKTITLPKRKSTYI
jgi:hypothetical protein